MDQAKINTAVRDCVRKALRHDNPLASLQNLPRLVDDALL